MSVMLAPVTRCLLPVLLLYAGAAVLSGAEKYKGPRPPQADLPFLMHADTLVPTEAGVAQEEPRKGGTAFVVNGTASSARTPLAEPIMLLESKTVIPARLQLYRLEVKNGKREVVIPTKVGRGPRPLNLSIKRLSDTLYQVEAAEYLELGQYALTPEGSNQVFLFEVY